MRYFTIIFLVLLSYSFSSFAQKESITIIDSGRNVSIRGLSVVNNKVIWISGSKGTVAKSEDGGQSFIWLTVSGYEKRDFRDIEAFDENTAIIMGIAEPAIILKTSDGGKSWKKVFEDSTKGMFLDAMDFDKKGNGSVIGDPIQGKLFQAFSKNFGDSWIVSKSVSLNVGEAFFASSGTNIQHTGNREHPYIFTSGGMNSRLFFKENNYALNLMKGKESSGANSVAFFKDKAIIVGGDFTADKRNDSNCLLVHLKKSISFSNPQNPPKGYRSCVIFVSKKVLVCCGTSGVDISYDAGKNWKNISTESFHVVQKAKKGKAVFLAGAKGKIARLNF